MTAPTDQKADSTGSSYDELYDLNKAISAKYHKFLLEILANPDHKVTKYLLGRGITPDDVTTWQLGYAPDNWRFMTDRVMQMAAFEPAVDLGVCAKDGSRNRDVFYDRLLIPRHDEQGRVIGFSGRTVGEAPASADGKKYPKYVNTRETVLFKKSTVLMGLHRAIRDMKRTKTAILTEGDFDVVSLHRAGFTNAVGKGGTALTDDQVAILKKYCDKITLIYDEDLNEAGQKALDKDLARLLGEGFRVKVFRLPQPEPTHLDEHGVEPVRLTKKVKVDADSWVTQYQLPGLPDLTKRVTEYAEDGLILTAGQLFTQPGIEAKIEGINQVAGYLAKMPDGLFLAEYLKTISKEFDVDKKELSKQVATLKKPKKKAASDEEEDDDEDDFPDWVDRKEFFTWGFAPRLVSKNKMQTGYYFASGLNGLDTKPLTNFVITPLYHIKDRDNVRRLVEIDNGVLKKIIEVNAKFLLSVQNFEEELSNLGHFGVDIGFERKHLKRIANFVMDRTPEVHPVKTLGYQPEGFFAFSNAVFNGHLEPYNQYGVAKVADLHYFSPALSPIYNDYRQDGDDPYKYDKYLSYHKTDTTFEQWSGLFRKVYGDRAMVGTVFAVVSLFKDVIRQSSKIPLLYCYGPKDSGKSQFAESLMYLFFSGKDSDGKLISSLNLGSSPTTSAFWTAMSRFRNCPYVFNEFDDQRIEKWVFSAFKSAWDGEGRTRQSKENKHLTEEQAVHCAPILVGQYLSTADDGSVTSRSLPFEFVNRKDDPFTANEVANFNQLKDWQREGLNGILTELLAHRALIVDTFKTKVRAVTEELKAMLERENLRSSPRTIENISCILGMYDTLKDVIQWPMTRAELWTYSKTMIGQLASLMQESDALGNFWGMVEYLIDRGDLEDGWDFKIDARMEIKGKLATGQLDTVRFAKPTRLLYVRMINVHKPYAEYTRKQSSEQPHRQQTIEIYLRQQSYFVAEVRGTYFSTNRHEAKQTSSNAFVLNYDMLEERAGVNLERSAPEPEEKPRPVVSYVGQIQGDVKQLLQPPVLEFRLQVTEQSKTGINQFGVKCFATQMDQTSQLTPASNWKVTGQLSEHRWKDTSGQMQTSRKLDVEKLEPATAQTVNLSGFSSPIDKGDEPF